jgi:hypothetical protein
MTEQGIAGLDVQAIESELTRLPEIVACRIVADPLGRPLEVHVLAHPGKHPKQVVRDIQSVALASFGLEIDRRIVSVVQLGPSGAEGVEPSPAPLARIAIGAIQSQLEGKRATIRVTLTSGSVDATGFAEGSIAAATRLRLVATATLDALRQLHNSAEAIEVEHASIGKVGSQEVVAVALILVDPPHEYELVGTALARQSPDVATVRAVLDAVNRRISYLSGEHTVS